MSHTDHPEKPKAEGKKEQPQEETFAVDFGGLVGEAAPEAEKEGALEPQEETPPPMGGFDESAAGTDESVAGPASSAAAAGGGPGESTSRERQEKEEEGFDYGHLEEALHEFESESSSDSTEAYESNSDKPAFSEFTAAVDQDDTERHATTQAETEEGFSYDLSHMAEVEKGDLLEEEFSQASEGVDEESAKEAPPDISNIDKDMTGEAPQTVTVEAEAKSGIEHGAAEAGEMTGEGEAEDASVDWTQAEPSAEAGTSAGEEEERFPADELAMDEEDEAPQAGLDLRHEQEEAEMAAATADDIPSTSPESEQEEPFAEAKAQEKPRAVRILAMVAAAAVFVAGGIYLAMQGNEPTPAPKQEVPEQPSATASTATMPQAEEPIQPIQEPLIEPMPAEPTAKQEEVTATATVPMQEETVQEETFPPAQETAKPQLEVAAITPQTPSRKEGGRYMLQSGAFILRGNLERAKKKLVDMGMMPNVIKFKKTVPMIRLRVGIFPKNVVVEKLQQVAAVSPAGAFPLPKNGGVAIYAGSFFYASGAERAAKELAAKGIAVEQEKVNVSMPAYKLHIGSFDSREAAEAKLAELKAAGIEAMVIEADTP